MYHAVMVVYVCVCIYVYIHMCSLVLFSVHIQGIYIYII